MVEAEQAFWGTGGVMDILWDATEHPPAQHWGKTSPNSPRTGRVVGKSHISTGRLRQAASCVQGWDVGRGWGHHPHSYLLLDPVAEVFLDEFAAGGGAEGQVGVQRLRGGREVMVKHTDVSTAWGCPPWRAPKENPWEPSPSPVPRTRKAAVWRVSSGSPQPSAWKHSSRLWGEGCC